MSFKNRGPRHLQEDFLDCFNPNWEMPTLTPDSIIIGCLTLKTNCNKRSGLGLALFK